MTDTVVNEVRRGSYLDSVALMRYSRTLADIEGVLEAAMMMGTPANKQIMADAGLLDAAGSAADGGDLVIGLRASSAQAAEEALAHARSLLDSPAASRGSALAWKPRSVRAAVMLAPQSNLALISVPGFFAAAEARKALRRGLHVMIFSDNVDVAAEAELKREARALGRLMMGPDCGTAIIGGVPLGFANVVPRGDIGIVGASGTGMQEIASLIAESGRGISQAIGVGGRDLDERVGGISTLMALEALELDSDTKHIVVVSKPPPISVSSQIMERIAASTKSFTVCFLGAEDPDVPGNAAAAPTLKRAAELALGNHPIATDFDPHAEAARVPKDRARIRGLFSGGSLCAEAQVVLRMAGETAASNAPIHGAPTLDESANGHYMVDLGDDEFTRGRPHPMIDPSVRDDAIVHALGDPRIGVVLLDLVIGHGAHVDPAGHLAALLATHARDDGPVIISSVTGTAADPQGRAAQIAKLEAAGVRVAPCNADAAALALASMRA
jgi:FdrA protein